MECNCKQTKITIDNIIDVSPRQQRERGGFKKDVIEKEPNVRLKQRNKERPDWQDSCKLETRPGELLRQKNKDNHVCNADVIH